MKPKAKKRNPAILILSLLLLLAVGVGGTVALLKTATNQVTNTFTPAEVEIEPDEITTATTKSDIKFKNTGDVPVYVRATLVIYWTDTINGEVQTIAPPAGSVVNGGSVQPGWFQVGQIYYYSEPVAPTDSTTVMLDTITVTVPDGSTAQCHIDVRAEAIQAEPQSAVEDAWTDVVVASGKLTVKGA